jgi:hypothetical protein
VAPNTSHSPWHATAEGGRPSDATAVDACPWGIRVMRGAGILSIGGSVLEIELPDPRHSPTTRRSSQCGPQVSPTGTRSSVRASGTSA